jgi:hypothetical protein
MLPMGSVGIIIYGFLLLVDACTEANVQIDADGFSVDRSSRRENAIMKSKICSSMYALHCAVVVVRGEV